MHFNKITILLCAASLTLAACGSAEQEKTTANSDLTEKAKKAIEESQQRGEKKAQKSEETATEEVVTDEVITEVPYTEAPTTEFPLTESPSTEQVMTEVPSTEIPITEQSLTEQPLTEAPLTQETTTELPSSETTTNVTNQAQLEQIIYGNYTEAQKSEAFQSAVSQGIIPPIQQNNGSAVLNYEQSRNIQNGQAQPTTP
ncbi:hypothetical protein ERX37_03350 [Macrococcus hajekii]|uniref:Uncharacterized protein n=1 Tax=Macrococcus hajekii TaxID=198482 RepID=A0A4V3BE92_9STAP|nr:hypothetical protein [Macrococcus hajekii]TDM03135.1 hypothetical protein ERX37_03350 [Macrococcus hajekii]GGA96235.1 hypothetical protein GCM10007190_00360 [Macrococcus hajekii]